MPDPQLALSRQDPKESVLASYAGALFIRCDPALEVRYPVVILQNDKANVYHLLEKHFRTEFLAPQERYWKAVKSLYSPALETWRPRVNGVQLKVLQGARLPDCEAEWDALDAALASMGPFLRSDSSVASLSNELRDFARILDVWWANRKRGEGVPVNKRPPGTTLALPINKRQSLEFLQQGLFSAPVFVQPEIISHSILCPGPMIQSRSADSMDIFFAQPPSAFAAAAGAAGNAMSQQHQQGQGQGPGGRGGIHSAIMVPQSVPQQAGCHADGTQQGPAGDEPALLHPSGGSQTLDPQGFLAGSSGSTPRAGAGVGSRCVSGRADSLARLNVRAAAALGSGALDTLDGSPVSQLQQAAQEAQHTQQAKHEAAAVAAAQQQQQQAQVQGLVGAGAQEWGREGQALELSPQPSLDTDLDKSFVALNVGGHRFLTTAATLAAVEGSFLWKLAQQCGSGGDGSPAPEYFIDRSGKLFEYVLDYLRCARFGECESTLPREARALAALAREANFYCMPQLAQRAMSALQQEQQCEGPQRGAQRSRAAGGPQQAQHGGAAGTESTEARVLMDALFVETGMQPAGSVAAAQATLLQQLNYKLAARQSEGYSIVKQEGGTEREGPLRNLYYHIILQKHL